jgi:hypothetical protein
MENMENFKTRKINQKLSIIWLVEMGGKVCFSMTAVTLPILDSTDVTIFLIQTSVKQAVSQWNPRMFPIKTMR